MSKSQKNDKRFRVRKSLRQEGRTEEEIKAILEANPETALHPEKIVSSSNPEIETNDETVQVDNHTETESGFGSLIGRARESLVNSLDAPEKPKRGRKPGSSLAAKDDFLALVVSVITLLVTFIRVDERIKPNKDEITSFSDHLAGIILRHSSISGKLSADAMAVIGMVMVGAGWYQRVSPYLHGEAEQQYIDKGNGYSEVVETTRANGNRPIVLQKINPAAASFLDNAVANHRED